PPARVRSCGRIEEDRVVLDPSVPKARAGVPAALPDACVVCPKVQVAVEEQTVDDEQIVRLVPPHGGGEPPLEAEIDRRASDKEEPQNGGEEACEEQSDRQPLRLVPHFGDTIPYPGRFPG